MAKGSKADGKGSKSALEQLAALRQQMADLRTAARDEIREERKSVQPRLDEIDAELRELDGGTAKGKGSGETLSPGQARQKVDDAIGYLKKKGEPVKTTELANHVQYG